MTVGLEGAQPQKRSKGAKQPKRRSPAPHQISEEQEITLEDYTKALGAALAAGEITAEDMFARLERFKREQAEAEEDANDWRAQEAEPIDTRSEYQSAVPPDLSGQQVHQTFAPPATHAPTGWGPRIYQETDIVVPSGQNVRIRRLERDDLVRLNIMEQLNTFAPMLLETGVTNEERESMMQDEIKKNPGSLKKMYDTMDMIVMACAVKPRVTDDTRKVNYGQPAQWADPNFTATAYIQDVSQDDRTFIFGAAFGRDIDALKSFLGQTEGVASVANGAGLQQNT